MWEILSLVGLFIACSLPFVVPAMGKLGLSSHLLNLLIYFFLANISWSTANAYFTPCGKMGLAIFLGFGIGYSLVVLRKNAKHWGAWLSLFVFLLLTVRVVVSAHSGDL